MVGRSFVNALFKEHNHTNDNKIYHLQEETIEGLSTKLLLSSRIRKKLRKQN